MSVVEVTTNGARADVVLNRPDVLNAMDRDVFDGLVAAADRLASASDIRVVVVSGAGRSFSSGIDTSSFGDTAGAPKETIARVQSGFRKLAALPIPTIAAVKGHALGARVFNSRWRVTSGSSRAGNRNKRSHLGSATRGTHRPDLCQQKEADPGHP